MSSQAFLWLNLGFAGLIALLFYLGRARNRAPSRLHLRKSIGAGAQSASSKYRLSPEAEEALRQEISGAKIKNLNVIFMYNGHSWDAYEVLGVPAGANLELVKKAYAEALIKNTHNTSEFIETAYRCILEKNSEGNSK